MDNALVDLIENIKWDVSRELYSHSELYYKFRADCVTFCWRGYYFDVPYTDFKTKKKPRALLSKSKVINVILDAFRKQEKVLGL
jgi:hypothetical protein